MKIMKCILICFIVVNLTLQGFIRSVFAANIGLKPPSSTEFALKVKPLTMNEQISLKIMEAKAQSLSNQAAGAYYGANYENRIQLLNKNNANSISPGHILMGSAILGAFFGYLASSGDDRSIRRSVLTGALYGVVTVSICYYAF